VIAKLYSELIFVTFDPNGSPLDQNLETLEAPMLCNLARGDMTSKENKNNCLCTPYVGSSRSFPERYRYKDCAATISRFTIASDVSNLVSNSSLPITLAACAICLMHSSRRRNVRIKLPS